MTLPFILPDWLPAWAFLLLALPVLLFALAFLLMPFSVFGVKSRLESLESQIDSLHEEVRNLAIRSTGMLGTAPPARPKLEDDGFDTLPDFGRLKSGQRNYVEAPAPPPIPPAPAMPITPVVEPRSRTVSAAPPKAAATPTPAHGAAAGLARP